MGNPKGAALPLFDAEGEAFADFVEHVAVISVVRGREDVDGVRAGRAFLVGKDAEFEPLGSARSDFAQADFALVRDAGAVHAQLARHGNDDGRQQGLVVHVLQEDFQVHAVVFVRRQAERMQFALQIIQAAFDDFFAEQIKNTHNAIQTSKNRMPLAGTHDFLYVARDKENVEPARKIRLAFICNEGRNRSNAAHTIALDAIILNRPLEGIFEIWHGGIQTIDPEQTLLMKQMENYEPVNETRISLEYFDHVVPVAPEAKDKLEKIIRPGHGPKMHSDPLPKKKTENQLDVMATFLRQLASH